MLVLSRKVGERILIGDNVVVQVLEAGRGRVRLGISAPSGVTIRREELLLPASRRAAAPKGRPGGLQLTVPADQGGEPLVEAAR
jgi:carbon storage regulator